MKLRIKARSSIGRNVEGNSYLQGKLLFAAFPIRALLCQCSHFLIGGSLKYLFEKKKILIMINAW